MSYQAPQEADQGVKTKVETKVSFKLEGSSSGGREHAG
jgi:hypothetical protein